MMQTFAAFLRARGMISAVVAICCFVTLPARAGTRNAPTAPNWTLKDLEGKSVRLSDFRGKVVILDFWATWCLPCRKEIPGFVELQKKYGPRGLVIIGVSLDEERSIVKPTAQKLRMNYRVVYGDPVVAESYGGIAVVPTTFVIDKEGKITALHEGFTESSTLEAEINSLL